MSDTPDEVDFFTQLAREQAEREKCAEAYREEMETKVWGPLRQLGIEYADAWRQVDSALAPVWHTWGESGATDPAPNPLVIGEALRPVGTVIAKYDEFNSARKHPQPTISACLAEVKRCAVCFDYPPPVLAAALVHCAVVQREPELIAQSVSVILSRREWQPALGWLPFIRDCLREEDWALNPGVVSATICWPDHMRPTINDGARLKTLLRPWMSSWSPIGRDLFRGGTRPAELPVTSTENPAPITPEQGDDATAEATKNKSDDKAPSEERQNAIIAAIRSDGHPLQASEIKEALRLKAKYTALKRELSWMYKNGRLIKVKKTGYWPADDPLSE
jgi:hypothetical protein